MLSGPHFRMFVLTKKPPALYQTILHSYFNWDTNLLNGTIPTILCNLSSLTYDAHE